MLYDVFRVIGDTGLVDHLGQIEADSLVDAEALAENLYPCEGCESIEVSES